MTRSKPKITRDNCVDFIWGHANRGGQHDWPFMMALHQGFFLEENINLEIKVIPGGEALALAMARGEIQVGRMGSPPFLTAVGNGMLSGKIIASSVIHNLEHYVFVVRTDIKDLSKLRGTTVGILSHGSCDGHLMKLQLREVGLDPEKEVTYRELRKNYLKIDGLASGELSAQIVLEPIISFGEQQGILRVVNPVSRVVPNFHWGLLVARDDFIREKPMLLRRLLKAYLKGAQYCVDHPEQTMAIVQESLPNFHASAIEHAVKRALPIWNTTGLVDMKGLDVAIETMRRIGAVTEELNPGELTDLSGLM